MIATGLAGTATGSLVLARMPETRFRNGMRLVLSLMALDLIRRALF
jgi:uncharacterized protein